MKLYSVFDSKAGFWAAPKPFRSRGEATRAWQSAANDKQTAVGLHPSDFAFYEIGEFNEDTGTIVCFETKTNLGLASEFLKEQ